MAGAPTRHDGELEMSNRAATYTRPEAPAEPVRQSAPVLTTYRRLLAAGLSTIEAGNLTAHLAGLHVTGAGWTPHEIEGMLFVRHLVEAGHLGS